MRFSRWRRSVAIWSASLGELREYRQGLVRSRLGWVLLLLAACGGPDEPILETWLDSAWQPVAVRSYAIDGKRDGRKTKAVATFRLQDGAELHVELEVSYNPQPVLSAGRWKHSSADSSIDGTVVEKSMRFFGGQSEGPSLGGSFRLDREGQPRFRVELPVRPVSKPTWQ